MDDALRGQLEELLLKLSAEVRLLDASGQSLVPVALQAYYLPDDLPVGQPRRLNGYAFQRVMEDEGFVLSTKDETSADDLLRLAASAVQSLVLLQPPADNVQTALLRLITEEVPGPEADALLTKYRIAPYQRRCVMLFSVPGAKGGSAHRLLKEMVPLEDGDYLIDYSTRLTALVKRLSDEPESDEAGEFALALQDTLSGEAGLTMYCGVGDPQNGIEGLRESCAQAEAALDLGPRYLPKERVFLWHKLLLPRFLSEIPAERAKYYHSLLFNRKTAPLFTPEMLETVTMFLQKDLNMSDTARQLYIHRNTLVYRLDKVQRFSGLDLRRFDDAFVFRLLYELRRNLEKGTKYGTRP